ncbi:MAG: hypothetical protein ACI4B3_08200 [Prevotella sp.]
MKKKFFTLACALMAMCLNAQADTDVKVLVDGVEKGSGSVKITFDGDQANLTFDNNSVMTFDIESLTLTLVYSGSSEVGKVEADKDKPKAIYTLGGQFVGFSLDALQKGIYIVDGKKVVK